MSSIQELHSAIRRFKSVKQHRDLVEHQYEQLRSELASKFDALDIQSISSNNDLVKRSYHRRFEYDIPQLRKQLNPQTFNFITESKLVVVHHNIRHAIRSGATTQQTIDKCRTLITETDVISILEGHTK